MDEVQNPSNSDILAALEYNTSITTKFEDKPSALCSLTSFHFLLRLLWSNKFCFDSY
jgi:hypothetical protein